MSSGADIIIDTPLVPTPSPTPAPVLITPAQVKAALANLISLAQTLVVLVPNDNGKQILQFVTNLSSQDWFVQMLTFLINAGKVPSADDFIAAIVAAKGTP